MLCLLPQGRDRGASVVVGTGNETKLANGDLYDGELQDGKPHGKGKLIRKKKGLFAGKGVDTFDGTFRTGDWISGILTLANGDVYQGEFKGELYHGQVFLFFIFYFWWRLLFFPDACSSRRRQFMLLPPFYAL